jgi:hypothetical protein
MSAGLRVMMMPVGTIKAQAGPVSGDVDTEFAVGFSPFYDYYLLPYLAVGFGPEFIFNVAPDGASESATFINLNARIKGGYPVIDGLYAYGLVTPGFSLGLLPGDNSSTAKGFALGLAGGASYEVLADLSAFVEAGYQLGFQQVESVDYQPNYFLLNLGAQYHF